LILGEVAEQVPELKEALEGLDFSNAI